MTIIILCCRSERKGWISCYVNFILGFEMDPRMFCQMIFSLERFQAIKTLKNILVRMAKLMTSQNVASRESFPAKFLSTYVWQLSGVGPFMDLQFRRLGICFFTSIDKTNVNRFGFRGFNCLHCMNLQKGTEKITIVDDILTPRDPLDCNLQWFYW